jgi:hypothetical protein
MSVLSDLDYSTRPRERPATERASFLAFAETVKVESTH